MIYNRTDKAGELTLNRFGLYLEWLTKEILSEPNVIAFEPWHFPYHKASEKVLYKDDDTFAETLAKRDRLNKYFGDVVPYMISSIRKHSDKIIIIDPPSLGHFDYANYPDPFADNNIIYATGGYGDHAVAFRDDPKIKWDGRSVTHPDPSYKEFKTEHTVPVMSMEGPGIRQGSWGRTDSIIPDDRFVMFDDVLKDLDENSNGWILHAYGIAGGTDYNSNAWGILIENPENNDPNHEGWLVDIIKEYIPPEPVVGCGQAETSIRDSCSSGELCCCSGTAPPPEQPQLGECSSLCQAQTYSSGVCRYSKTGSEELTISPSVDTTGITTNPSVRTWHAHEELIEMFKALSDAYPEYASYEAIGKSHEERDITLFKIGNPNGGKVMWDGSLHGWEDMGSEAMYLIAKWLLESDDEAAKRILQRNYVLFIPVVNMDSYIRQNMNHDQCQYGVDLNRNFERGWRGTSCGNYPNTYHGSYAASEPETQALRNTFQKYRPDFYVNTHYGGCGATDGCYGPHRDSDTALANQIKARSEELSNVMGVEPYSSYTTWGSGGLAVGDAQGFGASAWLIEVAGGGTSYDHTEHSYEDIVDRYYPRLLAIFVAMCEASEVAPTSCYTGETSEGQSDCGTGYTCCCLDS
jgi:hypothetical protein